ncbi:MAG: hypothetical protein V2J14_01160, partial [Erythrobacter sp.]|nr:hypothetical protein [Erythrobacter sp.]
MRFKLTTQTAFAATLAAGLALSACDVQQTEEGEMPEVEVEEGNMPEYEVDGPEIKAGTTETQVEVPDVDVDTET